MLSVSYSASLRKDQDFSPSLSKKYDAKLGKFSDRSVEILNLPRIAARDRRSTYVKKR